MACDLLQLVVAIGHLLTSSRSEGADLNQDAGSSLNSWTDYSR
jgi:hypothetical protein